MAPLLSSKKGFSICCEKFAFWRMADSSSKDSEYPQFMEVDPTGRYGRYDEILGMGASKTVYKGFDEQEGIEVAWNQVKLNSFLGSSENLERLYCEIHLLKTLNHKNIMKSYSSWVDTSKRKINFVTEMFTSGSLRQYRQKHPRVNIRALKQWCRQILSGLLYLHSQNPPIIHRDLKCDNIFVNGNHGEVKIGDLGLAAILRKPLADHCVGTPEFMAPEVYEEAYNELVDIYSFGMCVLEMVTLEYPYSECTRPVEIYKKVISGRKPEAFYKVENPQVRNFVEKCLAKVSVRLSARELLNDPFLQNDEHHPIYKEGDIASMSRIVREFETQRFDSCHRPRSEPDPNLEITIEGMRRDDGGIFLSIRISDREGNVRNIFFPFNAENDSAIGVATEMVTELNITDYDIAQIAALIDGEHSSLVSEWQRGLNKGEMISGYATANEGGAENLSSPASETLGCSRHGRFGEITYHIKESESDAHGASGPSPSLKDDLFQPHLKSNRRIGEFSKVHDHGEPCLEKHEMESGDQNEITSVSTDVYEGMKSFHLGRNFSYWIPSGDDLHREANNANNNNKSIENGRISSMRVVAERCF